MKTFNNRAALAIAAAAGSLALMLPAGAHHSTAMFDFAKTVEIKGTIKEFQWTNPHTWTKVDVEGGGAAAVEYGLEGMSPNYLTRNGWSKRTLKTGDKVATPPAKAPGLAVWAVKVPVAVPLASDRVTVRANAPT